MTTIPVELEARADQENDLYTSEAGLKAGLPACGNYYERPAAGILRGGPPDLDLRLPGYCVRSINWPPPECSIHPNEKTKEIMVGEVTLMQGVTTWEVYPGHSFPA